MGAPSLLLARVRNGWNRFWFTDVPGDSFAVLRIVFGLVGLVHLWGFTPVSMFWPIDGLAPVPGGGFGFRSLLEGVGLGTLFGWGLFGGLLVAFLAMVVGYQSRWATLGAFVGLVLVSHWNRLPLSSAHQILVVVLFCLMWADTSGWPSIDMWLEKRNGTVTPSATLGQPIWPLRLIRFHIAIVYLNSGLWKLFGPLWRDGSAVHYTLNLNIFHRFPLESLPPDWMLSLATYGTLAWELTFAFMLWNRWGRRLALIAGVLVHVGLWVSLELGPFSLVMLASYLAFLEPEWVSGAMRPLKRRTGAGADGPAHTVELAG